MENYKSFRGFGFIYIEYILIIGEEEKLKL